MFGDFGEDSAAKGPLQTDTRWCKTGRHEHRRTEPIPACPGFDMQCSPSDVYDLCSAFNLVTVWVRGWAMQSSPG